MLLHSPTLEYHQRTMAYDEKLAERVREVLTDHRGVTEKPLMGTLAFLVNGTLCCSVGRDGLLVRIDSEERANLLDEAFVSPMKMGTRTMKGFVRVAPEGFRTRPRLAKWIKRGVAAASVSGQKRPSRAANSPVRRAR